MDARDKTDTKKMKEVEMQLQYSSSNSEKHSLTVHPVLAKMMIVHVATEMLITGRLCWSVPYMDHVLSHMMERPISRCRPSHPERAILTLNTTN